MYDIALSQKHIKSIDLVNSQSFNRRNKYCSPVGLITFKTVEKFILWGEVNQCLQGEVNQSIELLEAAGRTK